MATIERVDPYYWESDEEGYWCAEPEGETGPDGKTAKGMGFHLYVEYPWVQLKHMHTDSSPVDFEFTEKEQQLFVQWAQEQYPDLDWNFDPDEHADVSVGDEYREGEDTNALAMRLCVNNPQWNTLRNEATIYYHMTTKFMNWCKQRRERAVELGQIRDEMGFDPYAAP